MSFGASAIAMYVLCVVSPHLKQVLKEFRDHQKVTDAVTLRQFQDAWTAYADDLARNETIGKDLDEGIVDKMSDEQRIKLIDLRFQTTQRD